MTATEEFMNKLSPKVVEIIDNLQEHLGARDKARTVEEAMYAVHEMLQLVDTEKDPLLEPEAFKQQMEQMRGILQRFKRF